MSSKIWEIKKDKLKETNLYTYSNFVSKKFKLHFNNDFNKLWGWSIENPVNFWKSIWEFTNVKGDLGSVFLQKSNIFYKNKFFLDSKLNYAQNLLSKKDAKTAIKP